MTQTQINKQTQLLAEQMFRFLDEGDWTEAKRIADKILALDPTYAAAYLGKLMAEMHVCRAEDLAWCRTRLEKSVNYRKALMAGDAELAEQLQEYAKQAALGWRQKQKDFRRWLLLGCLAAAAIGIFIWIELSFSSILPADLRRASVGDYVSFGVYEQDHDPANGPEAIEWLVLDKRGDSMLLISRYGLDAVPFNTWYAEVTWAQSTLRKWLNEDFLDTAFTKVEQTVILYTAVSADKNTAYSTDPGESTREQIFLLSLKEADAWFRNAEDRKCTPTAFASANGAEGSICWWWLRTPGYRSSNAACIDADGALQTLGSGVDVQSVCVRPAMWLNIG